MPKTHLRDNPVSSDEAFWARNAAWVDEHVRPLAAGIDASGVLPAALLRTLGDAGFLGSMLPSRLGGAGLSHLQYAALSEELGRGCSNVRNLVAVQDMVIHAIAEWGTPEQLASWVPRLLAGQCFASFALTEPNVGSDAAAVETTAEPSANGYVLSGTKSWISFGQVADVLLVFARLNDAHTAFLVERDAPGVTVRPTSAMLGLSGSMLGLIHLDQVPVRLEALVGFPGSGLTFVAGRSLAIGRLSTAAGCVGLAQACLEASVDRAKNRVQHGGPIGEQQLVRRLLTDMAVGTRTARLLTAAAARAFDAEQIDADHLALMAKYHASLAAVSASRDAVQLHGAHGLTADSQVARLSRDAQAMEVIEGTTQVIQSLLGEWAGLAQHPARATVQP